MSKPQVFVIHFAGGNCYSFRYLQPHFPNMTLQLLELPGRGRRMNEMLLHDFDNAVEDIVRQIMESLQSRQFLIYGHSMGAYLALRTANILEQNDRPPLHIIVSGNPGPGIREPLKRYLLDRAGLKAELRRLGGVPETVLENDELFNFFEPIIRADLEIVEKQDLTALPPISTPIYAIMGDREDNAGDIAAWNRYTTGGCSTELLPGDHFFVHDYPARIAEIITNCYTKYAVHAF